MSLIVLKMRLAVCSASQVELCCAGGSWHWVSCETIEVLMPVEMLVEVCNDGKSFTIKARFNILTSLSQLIFNTIPLVTYSDYEKMFKKYLDILTE